MSLMADAMQPHTVPGLMALGGRVDGPTVSDLILSGSYDLDFDNPGESFSLDFREAEPIVRAIGVDACRFASAAFQSMASLPEAFEEKDGLPWNLVKLYYSAFYAGHALIRLLGDSCSQLERPHLTRVRAVGSAMGKVPVFSLERGTYWVRVGAGGTALTYVREDGAAHESFWGIFQRRLHQLGIQILRGPLVSVEAGEVFAKLQALERVLALNGMSLQGPPRVIRNDLQYKHAFDVWFPAKMNKVARRRLGRLSAQWQRDPMTVDVDAPGLDPFERFAAACAFIVSVCRALIFRIAARSSAGNKCFICLGPVSFLRAAGLPHS